MKKLLLLSLVVVTSCSFAQTIEVPIYAVTSAQPAQPGDELSQAIDGNNTTNYHSLWSQNGIPDTLQFYFTSQVLEIGRMVYTPRMYGTNGIWTDVSIWYSTQSNPTSFNLIQANLIWAGDNTDKELILPTAIQNPYCVKIAVNQGVGNYSSCGEMRFFANSLYSMGDDGLDCSFNTTQLALNGANDIMATISVAGSTASQYQPGENIEASFDGDLNTLYHSPWGNGTTFPIVLNYRLSGSTPIDYLKYIPRSDGGYNGNLGQVTIRYNTLGNSTFQLLTSFDFQQSGATTIVHFASQITPLNIEITIDNGYGGYASCAEMQFFTSGSSAGSLPYQNVFSNSLHSALLPSITQAHIDTMSQPFYKDLAQCLLDGTYNLQYRVQDYEVYPTLSSINQNLKVGTYDNFENATGIVFQAGEKIALFAENIPSEASVQLLVKDFQLGIDGPGTYYPLQNGLNVIQLSHGGLAYVAYFNSNSSLNNIQINVVSGKINGYFDRYTSATSEWPNLMTGTAYPYVDVRGKYTHLVYEKSTLLAGTPFDGLNLIATYDTVVQHERMLMGLFKYNKSPKNRMLTYNEHGNGYYAGGLGVHLDLDWGPTALTKKDELDFWGIAHEYGHINQIQPDLNWVGTTEVTNNVYTVWVDYNMNHEHNPYTRLEAEQVEPSPGMTSIQGGRVNGAMYNTVVNNEHLQGNANYDVFKVLVPFWQLQVYYQLAGASKNAPILSFDYPSTYTGVDYAHWYGTVAEMSRNTNSAGLTNGELMMNFVKNTCDAVQEDLTLFFEKTGFLKPIDIPIDDYGIQQLTITPQMIADVKAYIAAQGYDLPVSPVIHYASSFSLDAFKNQAPLSGQTGVGVALNGEYLTTQHSEWKNAIAYETVDANYNLIYVSISGTGDLTNQTTQIYYPSNAHACYAVGFDGARILVYPASVLGTENIVSNQMSVYPNPIGNNEAISIQVKNDENEKFYAVLTSLDGRIVCNETGQVSALESAISKTLTTLQAGSYVLTLTTEAGKVYQSKMIKR